MEVAVVDYGLGNLRSVYKALKWIGVNAIIVNRPEELYTKDKIILPGVGHFAKGMHNLRVSGFQEVLEKLVLKESVPILGICLGMQLMTSFSEEGNCEGLAWMQGITRKFDFSDLKVPHMGWNNLKTINPNPILSGIDISDYFYFVHSYYVSCNDSFSVLTETEYGYNFVSGFNKGNIYGVQFHPEKSHDAGLELLNNFVRLI